MPRRLSHCEVCRTVIMDSNNAQTSHQYGQVLQHSRNCLALTRQLRNRVTQLHNLLFRSLSSSAETADTYFQQVHQVENELRECFDNLERCARALPDHLPPSELLNRLSTIFEEEQLNTSATETVETMMDSENWNERNFQTSIHLGELLRLQRHRQSSVVPSQLSFSYWSNGMSPHEQFESAFSQFQKELLDHKVGIFPTFLERTALGSVIELKFGVIFEDQLVLMQKMLMVENNGMTEHVALVAPHEEWSFYTNSGEKRVDLNKQSRYIVYQKLSVQANLKLMQTISAREIRWTPQMLHQFSCAFGKFQHVFKAKCKRCKKVMKDFLPPIIFDFRNIKNALHETCQ